MLLQSLLLTTILTGAFVAARPASGLGSRQVTTSSECPTTGVHVIAVSGDGANGADQYGLLRNLSTSILNAIPGSTTVQVPYDKYATNKLIATTQGSVNFTEYVNEFHTSCPCSKVAVIGYSSGAIISMNALCGANVPWTSPAQGFGDSYRDFIVGIIAYGDETRTAVAPYNHGTCTGNGRFPRTAANAACPVFADRIQSYCDVADPQCCLGSDSNAHFLYDLEYDGASTQFIKQKAASFGDICSASSTAPASPTASTPAPAHTSASASAVPTAPTAACPTSLTDDWQFPHLIIPVSSASPATAYGTSYDGKVDSTTSTIFNFDIPASYAGLTCSLFFNLPELSALRFSSYTTSGGPGVSVALLGGVADLSTSFANKPAVETNYGDFAVVPGGGFVISSGACAAGQRISYEMSATGNYALDYFQASGESIGLYVRAC